MAATTTIATTAITVNNNNSRDGYDGYDSHNDHDGHYSHDLHSGKNPMNLHCYTLHIRYKQTKPHQPPLWALSLGRQASKSRA